MNYAEFVAESKRLQIEYCEEEKRRIDQLESFWREYKVKANSIGLHPLTPQEITARRDELRGMVARVDKTHGDTPAMRAIYEMRRD